MIILIIGHRSFSLEGLFNMTIDLYAPPFDSSWLLDIVLEPDEPANHKGSPKDTVIRTLRGRENRVRVGVPQTTDVLKMWPSIERLDGEMEAARKDFEFYAVRLACSFVPDRGCRFRRGSLGVQLTESRAPGMGRTEPTAVDMFPLTERSERRYSRSFKVSAGIKWMFAEATAERGGQNDVLVYEPRIIGTGLLTATPSWTFEDSTPNGISGVKELFLLVKKSRDQTLRCRFGVSAEVQTALGIIPLRRYAQPALLSRTYELRPR